MVDVFMYRVMAAVTLCSVFAAFVAVYLLIREKRYGGFRGVSYKVSPQERERIREMISKRFSVIHNIYGLLFYTCNNNPKYKDQLTEYLVQEFSSGAIRNLSNDIIYIADLGEGGNLSRMACEYGLTEQELRTCCYIHLGFNWRQTCTAENLTENAYNVRCSRIRKKFLMDRDERLPAFIEEYCRKHN